MKAWERLPAAEWDDAAARHLLRRAGWTARPDAVAKARSEGLDKTLDRLFPTAPLLFGKTPLLTKFENEAAEMRLKVRGASGQDRQAAQREIRERSQAALQEFGIHWLQIACKPENVARAKWILFLSDVFVVSARKVRHAGYIGQHYDILGQHAFDRAPTLTKAIARSPAMVMYLDLERSNKAAPNENFARELFELFVLGEGNYSEQDVKEAARAFTGYRVDRVSGTFRFNRRQHDARSKTVFGKTGAWNGDDVIDLAYQEPSAAEFLPRELARYYLTNDALPPELITGLSRRWKESEFDLGTLARDFFGSRLFFAPEYRGNFIKSPVQFYLGLIQDLELEIPPLPRYSSVRLRQMGQALFQPPNVRGWLGGRTWINSSTLAARRQLAQQLFSPLREEMLNADEAAALAEARASGAKDFVVSSNWIKILADAPAESLAERLATTFLPGEPTPELVQTLRDYIKRLPAGERRAERLRIALIALLQTPEYQLC